ncbi:DUF4105 domain-containing protein [Mariniblastus sp.]|nr:DUF4105 domain-containing protein [Mariniblastus sp.]
MERLPTVAMDAGQVTLRNIRHNTYVSEDDFVVDYFDRQFSLSEIQSVDFIVVPFKVKQIAHTMVSFGLQDGTYLAVSMEVRKEKGERYNPALGLGRQFELMYLVGDERDLIRLRTEHRNAQVYVYPSVATPEQAQALFLDVMERANHLAANPEFYNTVANNCTTNLAGHVNEISSKKIRYGWRVLLPGLSAKYAYDLGLLDNRIPFEELKEIALVNDLALQHSDAPDFSQKIRARHSRVARYAELDARFK